MGMSQNTLSVEGFSPIVNLDSLSQRDDTTAFNLAVANQPLYEASTVLIVSQPSEEMLRDDNTINKQPLFVVTELPSNQQAVSNNCTYIQVPTNIIQMPSLPAPNVVNLIQVPTINVQVPSTLLVANNNLILCVPPEGITLQMQTDSGLTDVHIEEDELLDIQSKTAKAKLWHADSDLVNRALLALGSDAKHVEEQNAENRRRNAMRTSRPHF